MSETFFISEKQWQWYFAWALFFIGRAAFDPNLGFCFEICLCLLIQRWQFQKVFQCLGSELHLPSWVWRNDVNINCIDNKVNIGTRSRLASEDP